MVLLVKEICPQSFGLFAVSSGYSEGHRSITTTQRYVEIYDEIYGDLKTESYIIETAVSSKQAKKIIEQWFQYVCEIDGEKLFRKIK